MDGYFISSEQADMNLDVIHGYLSQSYWAEGIPRDTVASSVQNSLCFGLFTDAGQQVGFARLITDQATFAYLADVFVLEPHRGQGLSKWLLQTIFDDDRLQGLRRWLLATADAHNLYTRFGFRPLQEPGSFMTIHRPGVYHDA